MPYYADLDHERNSFSDPCTSGFSSDHDISAVSSDTGVESPFGAPQFGSKPVIDTSEFGTRLFCQEYPLLFKALSHVVSNSRRDRPLLTLPGHQRRLLNSGDKLSVEDAPIEQAIAEVLRELNELIQLSVEDSFRAQIRPQEFSASSLLPQEDPALQNAATESLEDPTSTNAILLAIYALEDNGENPWIIEAQYKDEKMSKHEGGICQEESPEEAGLEEQGRKGEIVDSGDHIVSKCGIIVADQMSRKKTSPYIMIFVSLFLILLILTFLTLMFSQSHKTTNELLNQTSNILILRPIHIVLAACDICWLWTAEISTGVLSRPAAHLARARYL